MLATLETPRSLVKDSTLAGTSATVGQLAKAETSVSLVYKQQQELQAGSQQHSKMRPSLVADEI